MWISVYFKKLFPFSIRHLFYGWVIVFKVILAKKKWQVNELSKSTTLFLAQ